ncbi:MAG TPA: hypothetical protein VN446_09595 [Candidatus Acidoferrum sp.]|nr:hypothetical protein [Candidatus Acidoferrum sp.]
MNAKNSKRELKRKQDEAVSSRIALYLVMTLLAVLALTFLYRMVSSFTGITTFNRIVKGIVIMSGLCLAASLGWAVSSKGKDCERMLVTPGAALFLSAVAFFGGLFMKYYYNDAVKLLFVMLPAICVLYIIKYVFGYAFFTVAAYLAGACCLLYVFDRFMLMELLSRYQTLYGGILIAVGVFGAALFYSASKGKGEAKLFGKKVRLFAENAKVKCLPAYIAAAAVAVIGAIFINSPSVAMYYGLVAMGSLTVLFAIYYTYTLMYQ